MPDLSETQNQHSMSDKISRNALRLATAVVGHRHFNETGQFADWSDEVMNASSGAVMNALGQDHQDGRWSDLPPHSRDVAAALSNRLVQEYGQAAAEIPLHETVARGEVDQSLQTAANWVGALANDGAPLESGQTGSVRDAMSQAMIAVRDEPGTPEGSRQNFGARVGTAAAEAGIRVAKECVANRELNREFQRALGASPAPGSKPPERAAGNNAARPTPPSQDRNSLIRE